MYKILLFFNTLKYLKISQIFYLLKIRVVKKRNFHRRNLYVKIRKNNVKWIKHISKPKSMKSKNSFIFLNKKEKISAKTDWNSKRFSKLWLYNLHYFDDLHSNNTSLNQNNKRLELISNWIDYNEDAQDVGWEPYPLSIRIVNWIKWQFKGISFSEKILKSLLLQADYLSKNLENHLLGNHILTNVKALMFAGLFFDGD